MKHTAFVVAMLLAAPAMAASGPIDEAKCIAGAASLIPQSPVTSITGAAVRLMTPAEIKQRPLAGAWADVRVTVLGKEATYLFMCGTNGDGQTAVMLIK